MYQNQSLLFTDSSFRDVSDLTAGGIAMSVPLNIPMYPPQRDESNQQVSSYSTHTGTRLALLYHYINHLFVI